MQTRASLLEREPINLERPADVRFGADNELKSDMAPCPKSANKKLMHRSNLAAYSITSVACASNVAGTVRPSDFAVLRLMTRSNMVGCKTGRSAGFSPLSIRPT